MLILLLCCCAVACFAMLCCAVLTLMAVLLFGVQWESLAWNIGFVMETSWHHIFGEPWVMEPQDRTLIYPNNYEHDMLNRYSVHAG